MKLYPVNTIANKKNTAIKPMSFSGSFSSKFVNLGDKLELSTKSFNKQIKTQMLYSKILTSLPQIEPTTIDLMIEKFSDYPKEVVLLVMVLLEAFAPLFVELLAFLQIALILGFI